MATACLGLAMHWGWGFYGQYVAKNEDAAWRLEQLDGWKNTLAALVGLGPSFAASGHMYPASFAIWVGGHDGFPNTVLMDGLRARGITPMIYWEPNRGKLRISSFTLASPATVTVTGDHLFKVGDQVRFEGNTTSPAIDGLRTVTSVPSARTFSTSASVTAVTPPTGFVRWDPVKIAQWQNWADGRWDYYLDDWAEAANEWRASAYGRKSIDCSPLRGDSRIIFRMSQEFNANWFPWGIALDGAAGPQKNTNASFKAGWKHIHDRIRIVGGADHIKMFYCPQGETTSMGAMFPGDDYVQYMGYDKYVHFNGDPNKGKVVANGSVPDAAWGVHDKEVARCAGISNRPVIIGETGVGGGGVGTPLDDSKYPQTGAERARWFDGTGGVNGGVNHLIQNFTNLAGMTYFNINTTHAGEFPDWTMERNPECLKAWADLANMHRKRYYDP